MALKVGYRLQKVEGQIQMIHENAGDLSDLSLTDIAMADAEVMDVYKEAVREFNRLSQDHDSGGSAGKRRRVTAGVGEGAHTQAGAAAADDEVLPPSPQA